MARILLAEDDGAARALMARGLASDGHIVTEVEDGQAALDRIQADPTGLDVLVSDVEMPLLDGIELARQALALKPGLKVLLISGFAEGLEKAAGLGTAGIRRLGKPASIEKVREEVRALLA